MRRDLLRFSRGLPAVRKNARKDLGQPDRQSLWNVSDPLSVRELVAICAAKDPNARDCEGVGRVYRDSGAKLGPDRCDPAHSRGGAGDLARVKREELYLLKTRMTNV